MIGIRVFFKSIQILFSDKEIRRLSLIPIFIFLILLVGGIGLSMSFTTPMADQIFAWSSYNPNSFMRSAVSILVFIIFFFINYMAAFFLTTLLTIPIQTKISEKTLLKHTTLSSPKKNFKETIVSSLRMLRVTVMKALVILILTGFLFLCGLFPILTPFVFLASALVVVVDCSDYVFEIFDYGIKERWAFFKKNFFSYFGLSLGAGILMLIPIVQLATLPVLVCSTTLLFSEIYKGTQDG